MLQTLEELLLSKDLTKKIVVQSSDDFASEIDPDDNHLSTSDIKNKLLLIVMTSDQKMTMFLLLLLNTYNGLFWVISSLD